MFLPGREKGDITFLNKAFERWNTRYPAPTRAHSTTFFVKILFNFYSFDVFIFPSFFLWTFTHGIYVLQKDSLEKGLCMSCVFAPLPHPPFSSDVHLCPVTFGEEGCGPRNSYFTRTRKRLLWKTMKRRRSLQQRGSAEVCNAKEVMGRFFSTNG